MMANCSLEVTNRQKKYWKQIGIGIVIIVCLGVLGVWGKDEMQFRAYVNNHDYNSLEQLIIGKEAGISKKERAINALIAMKDEGALKTVESCLENDKLEVYVEKIIWKQLAQDKVTLPSGLSILTTGKVFGDTAGIKEYFSSVMPLDEVNTAIKKLVEDLVKHDEVTPSQARVSGLLKNTKDIVESLPEQEKAIYAQITSLVNAWGNALHMKEEGVSKITEAQKKVADASQVITQTLNKMHSIVMATYQVQNTRPIYDETMRENYSQSINQVDSTVRAMANNLSGGDLAQKAMIYVDMGARLGNQNASRELMSLAGDIAQRDKELKESNDALKEVKAEYAVWRLDAEIQKCKKNIINLVVGKPNLKAVSTVNRAYKLGILNEIGVLSDIGAANSKQLSFSIDLLGNGDSMTLHISERNSQGRELKIKGPNITKTFKLRGERVKCYVAYLRDEVRPDVIIVESGGAAGWLNGFTIIGATDDGTIDIIGNDNLVEGWPIGRTTTPQMTLDGKKLLLDYSVEDVRNYTGPRSKAPHINYKTTIVWNAAEKRFIVNK